MQPESLINTYTFTWIFNFSLYYLGPKNNHSPIRLYSGRKDDIYLIQLPEFAGEWCKWCIPYRVARTCRWVVQVTYTLLSCQNLRVSGASDVYLIELPELAGERYRWCTPYLVVRICGQVVQVMYTLLSCQNLWVSGTSDIYLIQLPEFAGEWDKWCIPYWVARTCRWVVQVTYTLLSCQNLQVSGTSDVYLIELPEFAGEWYKWRIPYWVARICGWVVQVFWSRPELPQEIHAHHRSILFRWQRRSCRWKHWRAEYSCRPQIVVSNVEECHFDLPQAESWLPGTVHQTKSRVLVKTEFEITTGSNNADC